MSETTLTPEVVWSPGAQGRDDDHAWKLRKRAAWSLAAAADLCQLALFPLFGEGLPSPVNDVLDAVVGAGLTLLIGFHWSFVPAMIAESLPIVDVAPTWTGSVWLATRAADRKRAKALNR